MRPRRLAVGLGAGLAWLCAAGAARADEPVAAQEPRLMSETAEITSVADAFDGDDPFDLNLILGFRQSWKHAAIRRETQLNQPGLATGGFIPATENIASYNSSMSTLDVGADVGLYKDLALILRVPVILSWSQSLGDLNGSANVAPQTLADPQGGQPLFSVPFTSPTRSGIDYISAGLDWAIFNQQRDPTKPTWVIGVEGRLSVGTPLHACNATAGGQPECFDSSNNTVHQGVDPGISEGFDSILAKTIWSKRFGYVEPYSGFWFQADFPTSGSDFGKFDPQQNLSRMPPLQGSFGLGTEVIPWEQREQFQRVLADFRILGTYRSPGRDYSELFDALGSSNAPSLRTPNPTAYTTNPAYSPQSPPGTPPSIADSTVSPTYFTGITETQAYGSVTGSISGTWQAGEYIKFTLGTDLTYVQSHLVTAADPCNPNVGGGPGNAGPCISPGTGTIQGVPNPDHRDAIDLPGHRFAVDDTTIVDLYVMGVVMF